MVRDEWFCPARLDARHERGSVRHPTQEGTYSFWLWLRLPDYFNGSSGCSSRDNSEEHISITIVPGLAKCHARSRKTAPGTTGVPYSLQMTATVSEAKTWSISSGALPPGLGIDANTGLISGTPAAAGQFDFQVLAKMNGDARSDTKSLSITVRDRVTILGSDPFTAARRAVGEMSVPFDATLAATGGDGTYTWSLTSGALPPGLTMIDGAITGKPTTPGAYPLTVTVTDSEARVGNYPARIVIAEKLAISTLRLRPGKVGKRYRTRIATSGGVKPATWRIVGRPTSARCPFRSDDWSAVRDPDAARSLSPDIRSDGRAQSQGEEDARDPRHPGQQRLVPAPRSCALRSVGSSWATDRSATVDPPQGRPEVFRTSDPQTRGPPSFAHTEERAATH